MFKSYYKERKGISLKQRVNFKQRLGSDTDVGLPKEMLGMPVLIIYEDDPEGRPEPTMTYAFDNRLTCQFCKRIFNLESFPKHQKNCQSVYLGRRVVFDSAVYRLSLSDKDPEQQIQAMNMIFNTGKRKLNENWRLH